MNREHRWLALIVIQLIIFFSASHISQSQNAAPRAVSLLELVANPNKFEGQLISATGFLGLDAPDGDMLYLHKEDYDHGILLNAVGVQLSKELWSQRENLNENYVTVVGVFRSGEKSGNRYNEILDVRKCSVWSRPADPIRRKLR